MNQLVTQALQRIVIDGLRAQGMTKVCRMSVRKRARSGHSAVSFREKGRCKWGWSAAVSRVWSVVPNYVRTAGGRVWVGGKRASCETVYLIFQNTVPRFNACPLLPRSCFGDLGKVAKVSKSRHWQLTVLYGPGQYWAVLFPRCSHGYVPWPVLYSAVAVLYVAAHCVAV